VNGAVPPEPVKVINGEELLIHAEAVPDMEAVGRGLTVTV
jgi:hypothetical protein